VLARVSPLCMSCGVTPKMMYRMLTRCHLCGELMHELSQSSGLCCIALHPCMMDITRTSGGVLDNGPRCLSGTPSLLAPKTCRAV
jgi:hypothetical protein